MNGLKVDVRISDLLEKLRVNRETHHHTYEKAFEGYRQKVIQALNKNLEEAQKGGKVVTRVGLECPTDHTDDYDCVISMLEMASAACGSPEHATIEVTQEQFSQYVNDDWGWKEHFLGVSSQYT